jgi:hypothetical protein
MNVLQQTITHPVSGLQQMMTLYSGPIGLNYVKAWSGKGGCRAFAVFAAGKNQANPASTWMPGLLNSCIASLG